MTILQSPFHSDQSTGISGHIRRFTQFLKIHRRFFKRIFILLLIASPFIYEIKTSAFSSWILSNYAQKLSYKVAPGPSPNIVFPKHGPFDIRTGYALIPEFEKRLRRNGYQITEQARFSVSFSERPDGASCHHTRNRPPQSSWCMGVMDNRYFMHL